ncbi:MAG: DUF1016 domain-containing protein [Synechococcaceae cyanobacterium SM2_3_2]|nr:DUF1016 domain-containing protein [Synechococcaceae cyanobacterium SM2_3_2]
MKRAFYELELMKGNWSQRELKRQIQSLLYERVGLFKDKDAVLALAERGQIDQSPAVMLRDPYVIEFLGRMWLICMRVHLAESCCVLRRILRQFTTRLLAWIIRSLSLGI